MVVELIGNVLARDKILNVVSLHLLDYLDGVADDCFQETCDGVSACRLVRVILQTGNASILYWAVRTEIHWRAG